jgi:energy-coupling factor transport system substrate-specific component
VSGTSLTFNIAHAVGNVVFALLLGPAFIRALARYRRRFEVTWRATAPAVASALCALAVGTAVGHAAVAQAASPSPDLAPAIARATHYLRFAQNADGGFGPAPHSSSTGLHTGWTALGLASVGRNPRDVHQRGHSVIDYVSAHAGALTDIGELERTLLVLRAAGMKPVLNGHNLLARLIARQRPDGSFGTVNHTAFGILALRAGGRATRSKEVSAAARLLLRAQNRDGGFGFSSSAASDVDDTGAALEAIAASGHGGSPVAARAVRYLGAAQRPDGGFAQMATGDSNAQSTAWAVQGLVAVGRDPRKFRHARDPLGYLASLQAADGSVRYSRTSAQTPMWVTAQALVALEEKPFPLRPAPRRKARTATVHWEPASQTTTVDSTTTPAKSRPADKPSRWPLYFMVGLGIAALAGMRLAWRRG